MSMLGRLLGLGLSAGACMLSLSCSLLYKNSTIPQDAWGDSAASDGPRTERLVRVPLGASAESPPKGRNRTGDLYEPIEFPDLYKFWELAKDERGWSDLKPKPGSKVVYVSSSQGSDDNSGLSPQDPVATFVKAKELVRNGHPDQILFKRGDVWTRKIYIGGARGRSPSELMVFGSYGQGPRPLIRANICFQDNGRSMSQYLAIVDFHCQGNYQRSGIRVLGRHEYILLENNKIEGFHDGVIFQTKVENASSNIYLRRNVIIDNYNEKDPRQKASGIYLSGCNDCLLEENIFDHNGWNSGALEPTGEGVVEPNIFSHNAYLQHTNNRLIFRGNIVSRASSHGFQQRSAGITVANVSIQNAIAGFNISKSSDRNTVEHQIFINNLALRPSLTPLRDKNHPGPRGWGFDYGGKGPYLSRVAFGNLEVDGGSQAKRSGVQRQEDLFPDNVYHNWGNASNVDPVVLKNADATLEDFLRDRGFSGSLAEMYELLRSQSKSNYDERLTAASFISYFKDAFSEK